VVSISVCGGILASMTGKTHHGRWHVFVVTTLMSGGILESSILTVIEV